MRRLSDEEVRRAQVGILDAVAEFCDREGIAYWLTAGTLIGALRHKGYIPWDDDIDLSMLRPDYDRFMRLFNRQGGPYRFVSVETDPYFFPDCGRVLDTRTVLYMPNRRGLKSSVFIDIFVHDNAPDDDRIVERMFDRRDLYARCQSLRVRPITSAAYGDLRRRLYTYVLRCALRLLPRGFFARRLIRNIKAYSDVPTRRVGDFTGLHRVTWDRDILAGGFIEAEFEGKRYKIPKDYDRWLRPLYPDYMTPPPPEARTPHHLYEAYAKEPGDA